MIRTIGIQVFLTLLFHSATAPTASAKYGCLELSFDLLEAVGGKRLGKIRLLLAATQANHNRLSACFLFLTQL